MIRKIPTKKKRSGLHKDPDAHRPGVTVIKDVDCTKAIKELLPSPFEKALDAHLVKKFVGKRVTLKLLKQIGDEMRSFKNNFIMEFLTYTCKDFIMKKSRKNPGVLYLTPLPKNKKAILARVAKK